MSSTTHGTTPYYFVPGPSRHPAMAALGLFFVILGAGQWINGAEWGKYSLGFGLVWWLGVLYQWFGQAISESQAGQYGRKIDLSFRWSMSWFIFSEVMFFGAFFAALWWARSHSVPALGSLDNALLWPDFKAVWPSMAAGVTGSPADIVEPFTTVGPLWLPTMVLIGENDNYTPVEYCQTLAARPAYADSKVFSLHVLKAAQHGFDNGLPQTSFKACGGRGKAPICQEQVSIGHSEPAFKEAQVRVIDFMKTYSRRD